MSIDGLEVRQLLLWEGWPVGSFPLEQFSPLHFHGQKLEQLRTLVFCSTHPREGYSQSLFSTSTPKGARVLSSAQF